MKSQVIPEILKNVFDELTKDVNPQKFFDWYGFKSAAIEVFGVKIGIGISSNAEAMKLFVIGNSYDEGDYRNFRQTFRIGFPKDGPECWSVELAQTTLQSFVGDFNSLFHHINTANQIMQKIRQEEATMLSEEEVIKTTLSKHVGRRRIAAEELGISERTLYRKIKLYDIE